MAFACWSGVVVGSLRMTVNVTVYACKTLVHM